MDMVGGPLRLKAPVSGDKIKLAENYGRELGDKLNS
jgi:hypothetical protein